MVAVASADLIAELERKVRIRPGRTEQMLRGLAGLLAATADRLDRQQLDLFDQMLIRLTDSVEAPALVQLSATLADLPSSQLKIIQRLARHEDSMVASPVLQRSGQLSDDDLVEIAACRGAQHGLAIAQRKDVGEAVVDILMDRGDTAVCIQLARNSGARFSADGYFRLAAMAERNDDLADLLVRRSNVPPEVLRRLLSHMPRSVRARILKAATPELRAAIEAAINSVESDICSKAPAAPDYSEALARIQELNKRGKLNDSTVNRFATWHEYRNLVAALAQLATVPVETVETVLHENDCYGLIVACRASRLNWNTTLAVISNRPDQPKPSGNEIEQALAAFESLNLSAAQWLIRFGSIDDFTRKFRPSDAAQAGAG